MQDSWQFLYTVYVHVCCVHAHVIAGDGSLEVPNENHATLYMSYVKA